MNVNNIPHVITAACILHNIIYVKSMANTLMIHGYRMGKIIMINQIPLPEIQLLDHHKM